MALYQNKGAEELSAILNTYKENYKQRFGQEPHDLPQKLADKLKEQQEKHFNSVFGQLTPSDLAILCKIIAKPAEEAKKPANDNDSQKQKPNKISDKKKTKQEEA